MKNLTILIGNVGSDPETINFDNGGSISKFSLATNESYKNKQGEKVTQTEWHNIQASGPIVGVIQQYVKKGDLIYVEGRLKTRSWDDKNGNKHYLTYIDVRELKMLGQKKEKTQHADTAYNEHQPYNSGIDNDSDDLPF